MSDNLNVSKTSDALANLTTPLIPQTPFAPWGVSPQAFRLLSLSSFIFFPYLCTKDKKSALWQITTLRNEWRTT